MKANSIQGNKVNDVDVVYTEWSNLRKDGDMNAGQVGFNNAKAMKKIRVARREESVIKRLNKTCREEETSTLREAREKRDADEVRQRRAVAREKRKEEARQLEEKQKADEILHYAGFFKEEDMNAYSGTDYREYEDNFM